MGGTGQGISFSGPVPDMRLETGTISVINPHSIIMNKPEGF